MPRTQKKIAVVMTHGMGEQVPMETLRGFVEAAWVNNSAAHWSDTPRDEDARDIWFMPGEIAGSFELRRITTRHTDSRTEDPTTKRKAKGPRVDFFEFYWADLAEGTTVHDVVDWLVILLFRSRREVPEGLMGTWIVLWIAAIIVALLSIAAVVPFPGVWWHFLFVVLAAAGGYAMQSIISPYLGDVARYVRAEPRNIALRRTIRDRGVKLLQDIHDSGEYERVVIVAHSLGTIIAYDIVSLFWTKQREAAAVSEGGPVFVKLREVEDAARALEKATAADHDAKFLAYREAQRAFRLTLRNGGEDGTGPHRTPKQEWLISDLVTLGSPLTHAAFLLSRDAHDLKDKFEHFLFPTNCPQFQLIQTEQMQKIVARPTTLRKEILGNEDGLFSYFLGKIWFLHHAAPFAAVRWTNIYDPHRRIGQGDLISGPVSGPVAGQPSGPFTPRFGRGILDINLKILRGQSTEFSHTLYWTPTGNDPQDLHLTALLNAIDLLDTPDSELWKDMLPKLKQ